jgi:hypothetical protein
MRAWCGGGIARWLVTGYGIDGFGPGRWLVSLGNRQIVKSTAIADWQQKAGSWSAQRGGVERTGVRGGRGSKEVRNSRSVARVASPIFSHRHSSTQGFTSLDARPLFGSVRTLFPCFRPCDMACALLPGFVNVCSSLSIYSFSDVGFTWMGCYGPSRIPHSTGPGTPVDNNTRRWRPSRQLREVTKSLGLL